MFFFFSSTWKKEEEGAFLWQGCAFLFLREMNAKVELGHGLKVLYKDVGCCFAEVFAL